MAQRTQTKGACRFCSKEMTKNGLSNHFKSCKALAQAQNETSEREIENLYHILVFDKYQNEYWLHLEICGSAMLEELDEYLREIWLECCGHLSQFSFDKKREAINMDSTLDEIVQKDTQLNYTYDFGSSTDLVITVLEKRSGHPLTQYPITLLARNNPPYYKCDECEEPATFLCLDCLYEDNTHIVLCENHAKHHKDEEYGSMPLINSPRCGVCGYDGPAEPPY